MNTHSQAFEYVVGTLRGHERQTFEEALITDTQLQAQVTFWEEQFMQLEEPDQQLAPLEATWGKIKSRIELGIQPRSTTQPANSLIGALRSWRAWFGPGLLTAVIVFTASFIWLQTSGVHKTHSPNTDYVAVLTTPEGQATLTALTLGNGQSLWLQWETQAQQGQTTQLWAVSRRDGQARSLAVFDQPQSQLPLSQTLWRLITDAEYLILTQEEEGGSAIDEPSEALLAKGFCVKIRADKNRS